MTKFRDCLAGAIAMMATGFITGTAAAEAISPAQEYSSCLTAVHTDAHVALDQAQRWEKRGGGEAASHCAAAALFELGSYAEAATRLESLAQGSHQESSIRADMLRQAGRAWFIAHDSKKAYVAQSAALKLIPNDPQLLVDRAATLAETMMYKEAIVDLDRALKVESDRPDALLFRATAHRFLNATALAKLDIERLISLNPGNVDGLLERGIQSRLAGHPEAARKDWLKIIQLDPSTPAAAAARRNIELLDGKEKN